MTTPISNDIPPVISMPGDEQEKIVKDFVDKLLKGPIELPREYAESLQDNMWELI